MANLVQGQAVSRWSQQWNQVNSPQHLTLQRPFNTPVAPNGNTLASPGQVFGADRLNLNIQAPSRKAPVMALQQQASASSINRAIDLATGTKNTFNNSVELLVDGKEAFAKISETILSAKKNIYLEMFLFHGDPTGWDIAQKLVAKRGEGLDVKVLLDGMGQVSENGQIVKYLEDNGVDVQIYNSKLFDWENVNITHRKLVLVDGYKGITGGMNIGDEYAHKWHDLMAYVEGETVQDLQGEFFVDWTKSGGQMPLTLPKIPQGMRFGNSATRVTVTSPYEAGKEKDSKNAFISAIHSSLHHIYLENPYFSDEDLVQALISAAKRGVEVKILLPGISDNPVHAVLNKRNSERLLEAGAEVYKVDPGKEQDVFTHGKLMTIDGVWTTIGSTNFDTRALENNQELNISVTDANFTKTVEDRLFKHNSHALIPFSSDSYSSWERVKANVFSFFDRVF